MQRRRRRGRSGRGVDCHAPAAAAAPYCSGARPVSRRSRVCLPVSWPVSQRDRPGDGERAMTALTGAEQKTRSVNHRWDDTMMGDALLCVHESLRACGVSVVDEEAGAKSGECRDARVFRWSV